METFNFTYSDLKSEGKFDWNKSYQKIFDRYYSAVELYQSGNINQALSKFRYILRKKSDFVPAINEIAWYYTERYNFVKAKEYYETALNLCNSKIPDDFEGIVPWHFFENRHYLRTLQGYGIMCMKSLEYENALALLEKNYRLNPNDNQGIRYLLGDVYLFLNNYSNAEKYFKEYPEYSPYRYSYGVLLFKQKKYLESIVQFCKGIIENEFIFKLIINEQLEDSLFDDFRILSDIQEAESYHNLTLTFWFNQALVKFLKNISECELFKVYLEQINKIKAKSEFKPNLKVIKVENVKQREKMLNEINEYSNLMDEQFAKQIFYKIYDKF